MDSWLAQQSVSISPFHCLRLLNPGYRLTSVATAALQFLPLMCRVLQCRCRH